MWREEKCNEAECGSSVTEETKRDFLGVNVQTETGAINILHDPRELDYTFPKLTVVPRWRVSVKLIPKTKLRAEIKLLVIPGTSENPFSLSLANDRNTKRKRC